MGDFEEGEGLGRDEEGGEDGIVDAVKVARGVEEWGEEEEAEGYDCPEDETSGVVGEEVDLFRGEDVGRAAGGGSFRRHLGGWRGSDERRELRE